MTTPLELNLEQVNNPHPAENRRYSLTHILFLCAVAAIFIQVSLSSSRVSAQPRQLPHFSYFTQIGFLNDGDFKGAIKGYNSELRSAMKSANSRWIDSICCYTMIGECYYLQGNLSAALENYNNALLLYNQYPAWTMDVKFPAALTPMTNKQVPIPWGYGSRQKLIANFPDTFNIQRGQINQYDTVKYGGTVVMAHLIPTNISEIWYCTCLSLFRRYEILGPLAKEDKLTDDCIAKLSMRPCPPNHWSQTFVDVALGIAYLSAEKFEQALPLLNRGIVCAGQFDHPLSAIAFLALGQQALRSGNNTAAMQMFHEATVDAVFFPNATIIDEAFRGMSAAHLATNPKTPLPLLSPAIQWAKVKAGRRLHVSLMLTMAENLLYFNKGSEAMTILAEARKRAGNRDMLAGQLGARLNYLTAEANYQLMQTDAGNQALAAAMNYMGFGSTYLYRVSILDQMFSSGKMTSRSAITPRKAMEYYEAFLRLPSDADWAINPLETFATQALTQPQSYENWFLIALERKESERAVEIADQGRRARYFNQLHMGGRIFNFRQVLESPEVLLSDVAKTQKQNILAEYPAYAQLQNLAQTTKEEIRRQPQQPENPQGVANQKKLYENWQKIATQQEAMLNAMALRRLAVDPVFPPAMTFSEIQKNLPSGEAALAFFGARGRLFAFLINETQYTSWEVRNLKQVMQLNTQMHKELRLLEANKTLTAEDLADSSWRTTAQTLLAELLKDSKVDLTKKFPGLVIVPDGFLWYVPFEFLQLEVGSGRRPLISQFKIRYAPTASLSGPRPMPTLGNVPWTFAEGKLNSRDDADAADRAFRVVFSDQGNTARINSLTVPVEGSLFMPRLDRIMVWDDLTQDYSKFGLTRPMGIEPSKTGGTLADYFALPRGCPQTIIMPGFHTPEECSFRQVPPVQGYDVFFTACTLMSEGTQTLLLSRWRLGGNSTELLMKGFVEAYPQSDAAEAWQKSVLNVAAQPVKAAFEPRLKITPAEQPPRMSNPFFWGGYILIDSGALPVETEQENGVPVIEFKP